MATWRYKISFCFSLLKERFHISKRPCQCAKKVVSDSPGLVDFSTGLVNNCAFIFLGGEFTVINPAHQKNVFRLHKVTLGLVHSSCSLPEWPAEKLTFFAPCHVIVISSLCEHSKLCWERKLSLT